MSTGGKKKRLRLVLASVVGVGALAAMTGCDLQEGADLDRGEQLFTQKCGSCHTLTGAGTNSDVGPSLDAAFAEARQNGMDQDTIEGVIQGQIANPRPAAPEDTAVYMPANLVEGEDAENVAAFVASIAGVPGIEAPEFEASEFFATNCGGCHTLSDAGTTGTIGPNLDEVLAGQSPQQIQEQIVNPGSMITPGFPDGVMPSNYQEMLSPEELAALVQFITGQGSPPTGGGGAGASKKPPGG